MGYREYCCIPHDPERACPHPEDFPNGTVSVCLDILEGKGGVSRLPGVFADLGADDAHAAIASDVRDFLEAQRAGESVRWVVAYERWLEAVRSVAGLVVDPPWQLRKKLRCAAGPLEQYAWLVVAAEKLQRHRGCATTLRLDAHG